MPFIPTEIPDVVIFEPRIFEDHRGYFYESYSQKVFAEAGINNVFVQDNQAKSQKGVLRGLHYQLPPFGQAKLVRIIQGRVIDVVVDVRENSPTFGKSVAVELSGENKRQLFIPKGFAHGYVCLTDEVVFYYKCDEFYHPEAEGGIHYNDPSLDIDWQIKLEEVTISDKDKILPFLGKHKKYDAGF